MTVSDLISYFSKVEMWREIAEAPGYEVSSWGRVRGKLVDILCPGETKGYRHVTLCTDGKPVNRRVATLVAKAFLGQPPFEGAEIAHNDGCRSNNIVSNLRWTNAWDNQADIERHGNRVKGSAVFGARLSENDIPAIRSRALKGERYADIAVEYGVSISTVSLIKLGKIWRHV